jgi:predicted nuclease with TOPRIM domain
MKSEISVVKNDISSVKDVIENSINGNMSALETRINARHEELRQEINDFQERVKNIEDGQAEFEETVTRNLREDLSRNIEATIQDVEATRRNLEATQRDLETHPAALEARTRRAGGSSEEANADHIQTEAADAFIDNTGPGSETAPAVGQCLHAERSTKPGLEDRSGESDGLANSEVAGND